MNRQCATCQVPLIKKINKIEKPGWICSERGCRERNLYGTKYCDTHMPSGWKSGDDDESYMYSVVYHCPKCNWNC